MIRIFTDENPNAQTHGRHAAVDHGRWNRCRRYLLAGQAGILRTDVTMDEEARRLDIQLLADEEDHQAGVEPLRMGA